MVLKAKNTCSINNQSIVRTTVVFWDTQRVKGQRVVELGVRFGFVLHVLLTCLNVYHLRLFPTSGTLSIGRVEYV